MRCIIATICQRHDAPLLLHRAGKRRLAGDTSRAATSDEVKDLRREAGALKECVADLTLENRLLSEATGPSHADHFSYLGNPMRQCSWRGYGSEREYLATPAGLRTHMHDTRW